MRAMLPRFVFTFLSSFNPAPEGCECASMKPGTTVAPAASMIAVFGPARFLTSSFDPTATKRSFLIAKASAAGFASTGFAHTRTSPR